MATLTIAGQIVAGTAFDPVKIAKRYWEVVQANGLWQAEFRFTGEWGPGGHNGTSSWSK